MEYPCGSQTQTSPSERKCIRQQQTANTKTSYHRQRITKCENKSYFVPQLNSTNQNKLVQHILQTWGLAQGEQMNVQQTMDVVFTNKAYRSNRNVHTFNGLSKYHTII